MAFAFTNQVNFNENNYDGSEKSFCNNSGLTGTAVDFENISLFTQISSTNKTGAFRNQRNLSPYKNGASNTSSKYYIYVKTDSDTYTTGISSLATGVWDSTIKGLSIS